VSLVVFQMRKPSGHVPLTEGVLNQVPCWYALGSKTVIFSVEVTIGIVILLSVEVRLSSCGIIVTLYRVSTARQALINFFFLLYILDFLIQIII
jgi:hypothetical protein